LSRSGGNTSRQAAGRDEKAAGLREHSPNGALGAPNGEIGLLKDAPPGRCAAYIRAMRPSDTSRSTRASAESIWIYALLAFQPLFLGAVVLGYRAGYVAEQIAFWVTWAVLFPLVRRVNARPQPVTQDRLARIAREATAAAGIVLLHLGVSIPLQVELRLAAGHRIDRDAILITQPDLLALSVIVYAFLATFVAASTSRERIAEEQRTAGRLREQLAQSRFHALRSQLNPHFMFNGLNTVSMLVRNNDNQRAIRFLAGISDLLREALDDTRPQEISLSEEIAFIEKYLGVERVRFADRLVPVVQIAADVQPALVPTLILQPIVENAVRHGIARRPGSGRIELTAWRDGRFLEINVRDDGAGVSGDSFGTGNGLRLTEDRLHELYADEVTLSVESTADRPGALVRIRLPFHTQPVR
jgi:two-component system, LytTR family, sensor kinase